mmetsp:Transcript_31777/g.38928  ORF Transcript_31777/g.38928 Transcript_31777/m.38928 type:complete len:105 (-) Transcript_31777:41-355(-)
MTFAAWTPERRANPALDPPAPWKKNTMGQVDVEAVLARQVEGTSSWTLQVDVRPWAAQREVVSLRIWGECLGFDSRAFVRGAERIGRRRMGIAGRNFMVIGDGD